MGQSSSIQQPQQTKTKDEEETNIEKEEEIFSIPPPPPSSSAYSSSSPSSSSSSFVSAASNTLVKILPSTTKGKPLIDEARYEGFCYVETLHRPLIVYLCSLIVERKTKNSVLALVNFSSTCRRIRSIIVCQDTFRFLCEYERFASATNVRTLKDLQLFSTVTLTAMSKEQQDWIAVFAEKNKKQCSKCLRLFWMDEPNGS